MMRRSSAVVSVVAALVAGLMAAPPIAWAQTRPLSQRSLTREGLAEARNRMVDKEVIAAGIKNPRVIASMRTTPRHEFVARSQWPLAYLDMSLPIGERQTISAPVIVAYMTEQLDPKPTDKVLEIGTGSGYQAAVLSPLVKDVYSIEIKESLGRRAKVTLERLKYKNVHTKIGDGYLGWPSEAPFDKIIVTCSPEKVPQALVDQLKEGGRMIVPEGERYDQVLNLLKKVHGKLVREALRPTLFVPMTGEAEAKRKNKPDPLHPKLVNGSFEDLTGTDHDPVGWYYIRQMKVVNEKTAPDGKRYVTFTNTVPGLACRALQGFAIDGRKVHELAVSFMVRGKNMRVGPDSGMYPQVLVTFYDENRAILGRDHTREWSEGFDWRQEKVLFKVPVRAREAIICIGLLGATGEISFDNVDLHPVEMNRR